MALESSKVEQLLTQVEECVVRQRFGEQIRDHLVGLEMLNLDMVGMDAFRDECVTNVDVFRMFTFGDAVVQDVHRGCVVLVQDGSALFVG